MTSAQNASVYCLNSTVESIQSTYGTVNLKDCTFDGSDKTDPAVKIGETEYSNGATATELIIDNCSFSNYISDSETFTAGAAISAKAANVQIKNKCSFTGCKNNYKKSGGAIYIEADTVGIEESTFTNNIVTHWRGGAIYIDATKSVTLSDCTFTDNKNSETDKYCAGGGAVAILCSKREVTAKISNCTFKNNSCAVIDSGKDVSMLAQFIERNDNHEIVREYGFDECNLTITDCKTTDTSNALFTTKNITAEGNFTELTNP